ncbi:hypothetical protein BKH42_08965 [Helicobacter sp. 13S00482-2]|nr:hypothetical protein BKH42_08965 [Helicobacter sp. 13S00482-2]
MWPCVIIKYSFAFMITIIKNIFGERMLQDDVSKVILYLLKPMNSMFLRCFVLFKDSTISNKSLE